jgi:hypothetical protein
VGLKCKKATASTIGQEERWIRPHLPVFQWAPPAYWKWCRDNGQRANSDHKYEVPFLWSGLVQSICLKQGRVLQIDIWRTPGPWDCRPRRVSDGWIGCGVDEESSWVLGRPASDLTSTYMVDIIGEVRSPWSTFCRPSLVSQAGNKTKKPPNQQWSNMSCCSSDSVCTENQ